MNRTLWVWQAGKEGHSSPAELQRKRHGDMKVFPKVRGQGLGTRYSPEALEGFLLPTFPRV